ncbi:MAG: GDP-L-fucose synthase [Burkholderiales bacterium]
MNKGDQIYVAGHRGLAGSALIRQLKTAGYTNLITRTHAECDLTDDAAVREFFARERPDHVFLAAAKVGGIHANSTYPADFVLQNLAIQTNVVSQAWRHGVKRLLFLGSSCIYPRDCPQPMRESSLLNGPLEPTNRPYAIAKIAGIELCWALNRQHRTRFVAAMPTNLYGPGDNYDLQNSHVLPALIRKMHEAKTRGDAQVTVWGTGTPRREFLYSNDMADACILLMRLPDAKFDALLNPAGDESQPPLINIGCGVDHTIRELAETVAAIVGYEGKLAFDTDQPDGTPRKLLDVSRLQALGWQPRVGLQEGIRLAYRDYCDAVIVIK